MSLEQQVLLIWLSRATIGHLFAPLRPAGRRTPWSATLPRPCSRRWCWLAPMLSALRSLWMVANGRMSGLSASAVDRVASPVAALSPQGFMANTIAE